MQFVGFNKVKVEWALCTLRWLCHNDVRPTKLHKWHRVFGELGALPKIREEYLGTANGFRIFPFYVSVVDGSCLVRCKTLIYCRQLCNNAVNYPSTPLRRMQQSQIKYTLMVCNICFFIIDERIRILCSIFIFVDVLNSEKSNYT
jgi:hypothetical protein